MKIFTDGSGILPDYVGTFCFIVVDNEQVIYKMTMFNKNTTSNRMELSAVMMALSYLYSIRFNEVITIYSDSLLTVNCFNKLWKTKSNLDLWKNVFLLKDKLKHVKMEWVKSHSGNIWNEYCDKECNKTYPKQYKLKF